MMKITKVSVAKDFSTVPIGRYYADGPVSGQAFRERLLVPALERQESVEVDFDGVEGYGSSFLEEAFGGLIREHGFSPAGLLDRLSFISTEDPSIVDEVKAYIAEAGQ